MKLNLVIKKVTLSETAGPSNWGDFSKLLELPLSIHQSIKVTEFFEAAEFYRLDIMTKLSLADGHGYKFVSETGNLTAYTYYGIRDIDLITNVVEAGDEYNNFIEKRDNLFSELGWTVHESRVADYEADFDEENQEYTNLPTSMQTLTELYNSSPSLSSVLGN